MLVSMFLEHLYENNLWLRILFIIIGVVGLLVLSGFSQDNFIITAILLAFCTIQRTVFSILVENHPNFPEWILTVGLIVEIILAIIVIASGFGDGLYGLLRGGLFLYEAWFVSGILARTIFYFCNRPPVNMEGLAIVVIVVIIFCGVTSS